MVDLEMIAITGASVFFLILTSYLSWFTKAEFARYSTQMSFLLFVFNLTNPLFHGAVISSNTRGANHAFDGSKQTLTCSFHNVINTLVSFI